MKLNFAIFLCLMTFSTQVYSQWKTKNASQFQVELNEWYASEEHSPFQKIEKKDKFECLQFFAIDKDFIVEATYHPFPKVEEKQFPTSSGKSRALQRVGKVKFNLNGHQYKLVVLKEANANNPEFADYYTIAFLDKTNGEETYGGGRYLGVWEEELEDGKVTLNFNLAYQPYCAYVTGYSCLIPPRENFVNEEIRAGVKNGIIWEAE